MVVGCIVGGLVGGRVFFAEPPLFGRGVGDMAPCRLRSAGIGAAVGELV
jgi:hypothetical protein